MSIKERDLWAKVMPLLFMVAVKGFTLEITMRIVSFLLMGTLIYGNSYSFLHNLHAYLVYLSVC